MKPKKRDYTLLSQHALNCGMIPYTNGIGIQVEGLYTLKGHHAPVDLSACAEDEKSILRTALEQLSEKIDDGFENAQERKFYDCRNPF